MLVFLEGRPRSGKSYTAVKDHILVALKKGRKVKARINGLDTPAIAKHLLMTEDEVDSLLTKVSEDDVVRIHEIVEVGDLVVIDECHKWWDGLSRIPMSKAHMTFFAEHGHKNIDVLLMSQSFSGVKKEIRDRVERKNSYQKLTAVGMEGSFVETLHSVTGSGKFEKIRSKTHKYDPAIYPLYHGYLPEVEDPEVYKGGSSTVWAKVGPAFIAATLLLCLGLFGYMRYFRNGPVKAPESKVAPAVAVSATSSVGKAPGATGIPVSKKPEQAAKPKLAELPPEAAYVWDLNGKGRARLSAMVQLGDRFNGYVEWIADRDRVLDRLSLDDLRSMGVEVVKTPYGVKLLAKDRVMVVTSWPIDQPDRISNQQNDDIRRGGPPIPEGSVASLAGSAVSGSGSHARVGKSYTPPELTTVGAVGE